MQSHGAGAPGRSTHEVRRRANAGRSTRSTRDRRRAGRREELSKSTPLRLRPVVLDRAALALLLLVLAATWLWLAERATWYLAVDQLGYLSFARDLLAGEIDHSWSPAAALAGHLPARTDLLAQTYLWDQGRIYSRYAIGFPLLVALWTGALGEDAAHALNPLLLTGTLAVTFALQRRLLGSSAAALLAVLLVLLCDDTLVLLWGMTPTRDISAHICGLGGLLLLLPPVRLALGSARAAAGGLALGFAAAIRPDAVLYLAPAALLLASRARRLAREAPRLLAAAIAGYATGIAPLLAVDAYTTGNPLVPTQAMELRDLLGALGDALTSTAHAALWQGGDLHAVQGGGLRLANLPGTLPALGGLLLSAFGPVLLTAAAIGAAVALRRRRPLVFVVVPYVAAALLLFGCWARAEHRYMVGVSFILPALMVAGTVGLTDLVTALARNGEARRARALAILGLLALAAAFLGATTPTPGSPGAAAVAVLAPATCLALPLAAWWPRLRAARWLAVAACIALTAIYVDRTGREIGARAPFQRPERDRAVATVQRWIEPEAIIVTTEQVGRAVENLEYHANRRAIYLTDLRRWGLQVSAAARLFDAAGMPTYLLLPPGPELAKIRAGLPPLDRLTPVEKIPAEQAIDWFVAAPTHQGVDLELLRLRPWPARATRGPRPPSARQADPAAGRRPARPAAGATPGA